MTAWIRTLIKTAEAAFFGAALYFAAVFDGDFVIRYFLYFVGAAILMRAADDFADYKADRLRGRALFGRKTLAVLLLSITAALPFCFFGNLPAALAAAFTGVLTIILFLVKNKYATPFRALIPALFVCVFFASDESVLRIAICGGVVFAIGVGFYLCRRKKPNRYICDYESFDGDIGQIGGKAFNLYKLGPYGCPDFFVIRVCFFEDALAGIYAEMDAVLRREPFTPEDEEELRELVIGEKLAEKISGILPGLPDCRYAVRSSSVGEDGGEHSFAGVMESYLNVLGRDVAERAVDVFLSAYSLRAVEYRRKAGLVSPIRSGVIVQKMADADFAGVVNTVNPITDNPDEVYISAIKGLGEDIVNGSEEGSDYAIDISGKVTCPKNDILGRKLAVGIAKKAVKLQREFDSFQDIEFAVVKRKIIFLQTRAITAYKNIRLSERILTMDNSNIVESYSGVVTDLTASYAQEVYADVYRAVFTKSGINAKTVAAMGVYYNNMVCTYNGRLYYNLGSWYGLVGCLPFTSGKRAMEKMMGLKSPLRTSGCKLSAFGMLGIGLKYLSRVRRLDEDIAECERSFAAKISPYEAGDFAGVGARETVAIYKEVAESTLESFVVPVINDTAAMLSYNSLCGKVAYALKRSGLVGRGCARKVAEGVVGELLGGKKKVISVRSLDLMKKITDGIRSDELKKNDFDTLGDEELWDKYRGDENICAYLREFGARVGGELKLETETFIQRPEKIIGAIKNFLNSPDDLIPEKTLSREAEYCLRDRRVVKKAELAERYIVNREKLRLIRTRTFSAVRCVFLHLGSLFTESGLIECQRDIFFLTKNEIFALADGAAPEYDIGKRIAVRKAAYEQNLKQPEYGRIVRYAGGDLNVKSGKGTFSGIPSGQGTVTGKVKLITDPYSQRIDGEIILAKQTDPGWIPLFMNCSGVIVERGSVLSHSAVISRELGIPCVVGLERATELIPDGSTVMINSSSGEVRIIEEKVR